MAVTREQVVETAILVLDEAGLAGLTLRQVAARLGVQAPALYWHVRSKRELLDLMAEEIVSRSIPAKADRPAPGQPWWDWLTKRTQAIRESLAAHPDSAQVIAGNRPTWKMLPQIEHLLGILVEAGFPPAEALQAMLALGNLVTGCVLEEQASANRPADPERDEQMRAALLGGRGRFPIMAAAAGSWGPNGPDTFAYGLRMMIAGLRGRHAELQTAADAPAPPASDLARAVAEQFGPDVLDSIMRELTDPANLPERPEQLGRPRSTEPRP